ncbi:MAG TPA: 2'-5' RNA ligase family protein [Cyclobacteriaceae bacterium]|nr:2'-5' RNA ligase family protein [Cyclobacteriaceae bacterium]
MTGKNSESRYFLAIVPPEPVYGEAQALKQHFKDRYNSKAALNSPPHITLHMPFTWRTHREAELMARLGYFAGTQNTLKIKLNNFSAFEPRVIFIDILKNERLELLQKQLKRFCKIELNLFNADYKELAFHPHITLAFRDLKKTAFYKAREEFKNRRFEATFAADSMVLLKHDGKMWKTFKTCYFSQNDPLAM